LEEGNAITILVDIRATKGQISEAFKKLYDVKPKKVNTLIRPDGQKKAFILMPADVDAQDIAAKLGIA
jgi:large subunit ribosomal protein L23Ae